MKEKTRKIFIMIVMAALIVSLTAASFAALTYGRYTGGKLDEDSPYEEIIDFVGATAFEVTSPDAFINAINNGYSYIKIADDAEEPFVINNNVADVYTNLVLDVNGHVVVRNSRNPLLDVRRSISVVLVYDSSTDADGGFYNPVGSSLQTSGGTLTVGEGVYESGPKIESVPLVTTAEISDVFVRNGGRASATKYQKATAAAQLPKPGQDVYLDETYSGTKNDYLKADTYLLYTVEKNGYEENGQLYVNAKKDVNGTVTSAEEFSPICNVASCDFYYYYPVDADGSPIDTEGTQDTPQTYAVIYGYNDVKALARDEKKTDENGIEYGMASALTGSGLVWPYAAIRSVEDGEVGGVTHARGGTFTTNFGTDNTYGIYSVGGTMTVGGTAEPTFSAVQSGVCIKMEGQGTEDSLTINSGDFSSQLGNTIQMEGGKMEVKKGTFTKTGCKQGTGDKQLENQTAIISLLGGTLNVSGTKTGDDTYSVTMTAGAENSTLENVFGIRADGGTVTTKGVSFHIYGDYSAGVLSYDGKINLGNDTVINVKQSDAKKDADNDNILLTSAGVSSEQASEGAEHPVNISGDVTITSNGLGITARGVVNVTDGESTVETTRGTGIYVNNGKFTVSSRATINVNSTVQSGFSWTTPPNSQTTNAPNIYNGVYVQGGSLVSEGTLNVTFTGVQNDARDTSQGATVNTDYLTQQTKSYAVRVETAASGSDTEVKITAGTIINQVQYDEQGKEIAGGGGGVLVNGGTVTLGKQETTNGVTTYSGPTVQTTGSQVAETNIMIPSADRGWAYSWNLTGGDAVKVVNGSLTAHGGSYSAVRGNGILVNSSDQNTQTIVNSGNFVGGDGSSSIPGAAASYGFKVLSGSININGGSFGTTNSTGGGAFVMNGKAYITKATIQTGGSTGFAVWDGADVTFEPEKDEDINVSAEATGLTLENGGTYGDLTVTIKGGTFSSTNQQEDNKNGIWYGNGNARLIISGGSFTGTTGSGLSIGAAPNYDGDTETYNIQLSGGSFKGGRNAPISNYKTNYLVSGAWTSGYNTSGQTFYIHS